MRMAKNTLVMFALVMVPAAMAQKWEFGGGAGYGFYTSQDVTSPAGTASAKFASGFNGSVWLDNDNSRHWGGELRYDYQTGNMQLSSGGTTAGFGSRSQAVHYDFLLHATPRNAKVRPYLAFGAGVKYFQGTGTEVMAQPLSNIALLSQTNQIEPVVSVGGGIKFNMARHFGFRVEAHDYMSPMPQKVIQPAMNASTGGWIHDIVISAGVSYLFGPQ